MELARKDKAHNGNNNDFEVRIPIFYHMMLLLKIYQPRQKGVWLNFNLLLALMPPLHFQEKLI